MSTRTSVLVIGLVVSLFTTACGTTVPMTTETTIVDASGGTGPTGTDGMSVPPGTVASTEGGGTTGGATGFAGGSSTDGAATTGGGGTATGGDGGTTSGSTGSTGSAGTTGTADTSGGTTTPSGPREPVQIGVAYVTGQEEGAAALGGEAREEYGSQRAMNEVLIEWMNSKGGINGHPIEPVWTELPFVDDRPAPQRAAEICQQWTQDNSVVAGIFLGPDGTELARCLNDAGAAYYQWGWTLHTQAEYAQIPKMFQPAEFGVERLAVTYADQLVSHDWFTDDPTVGLLVNDYAAAQAGWQILKQRLATHGIELDDANVYSIPAPESFDAIGASLSAIQNAQLRMRSSGVDHVLFLCWGCAAFFMLYAENQEWRPERGYGLTSQDLLTGLAVNDYAPNQLPGSMAVGYWPITDQGVINRENPVTNAAWDRCASVLTPSGTVSTDNDYQNAMGFCSAYEFFDAAARASGSADVTGELMRQGAERLGTSWQHSVSLHTNLAPDRHSGVDTVRMMEYVNECRCFEYFGPNIRVP